MQKSILKIHSQQSLSLQPRPTFLLPLSFAPVLPFILYFSFIREIESRFSEQEERSRSHSAGQSNREMTGATGKRLFTAFIYLFV